jgi:hypothetical protein
VQGFLKELMMEVIENGFEREAYILDEQRNKKIIIEMKDGCRS